MDSDLNETKLHKDVIWASRNNNEQNNSLKKMSGRWIRHKNNQP